MISKIFVDIGLIAGIYYLQFKDQIGRYLFFGFLIPVGVFFIATAATSREPAFHLRFFTASILLSFSMLTIMWLGSIIIEDRFFGRLKLFITAPVSPISYVLGILVYACTLGLMTGSALILFAYIYGIPAQPHLLELVTLAVLTVSAFTGVSIVVSQYAKNLQTGSVLADSTSISLIFFAPVYYPIEELPKGMQVIASLFPTTYAATGIADALSGRGVSGTDLLALLMISAITLTLAVYFLRWREP
ncbi:MAG: ABC transporter permease [Candidatus Binatia bacterium]